MRRSQIAGAMSGIANPRTIDIPTELQIISDNKITEALAVAVELLFVIGASSDSPTSFASM